MSDAPIKHAPIFAIVGPSGAGKNTLINLILASTTELSYGVSMTTRDPRPTDIEGEYIYCTQAEIESALAAGQVLEMAVFAGQTYATCTPDADVTTIIDLELQGAAQIRANHPELPITYIGILPMPVFEDNRHGPAEEHERHFAQNNGLRILSQLNCLKTQLIGRKDLTPEQIEKRLAIAREEIREIETQWPGLPNTHIIHNQHGRAEAAHREMMKIIKAELQGWRATA